MNKVFYDVQDLSMANKKKLIKDFQKNYLTTIVDELDVHKSWSRQLSKLKWTEVFDLMNKESMLKLAVIASSQNVQDKPYVELLLKHRVESKDIFLWIRVDAEWFYSAILPKYKLNIL